MPSLPSKKKIVNTNKRLLENRNWTFPVVRYFTWKLEPLSNISSVVIVLLSRNDSKIRSANKLGRMENSNKLHFNFRKLQIRQGQEIFRSKRLLIVFFNVIRKDLSENEILKVWLRIVTQLWYDDNYGRLI